MPIKTRGKNQNTLYSVYGINNILVLHVHICETGLKPI